MPEPVHETDVLVVGAGPTGLTTAIQARLMGARVRVIERRTSPREWGPALAVHPRTLEILRGLGLAEDLMERGVTEVALQVHTGGRVAGGRLHNLNMPDTRYPFILFVPQAEVEKAMRIRLSALGTDVEWGSVLTDLSQDTFGVTCRVTLSDGGSDRIASRYVAGCDGAASTVRASLRIPFRGRSYRQTIVIADADNEGALDTGTAHAFIRRDGIVFAFPLPGERWRLIAPHRSTENGVDLRTMVKRHTGGQFQPGHISWQRSITPQHRLATRYRQGRVFLAGDAAHVHSPAGAQGMNTGIQDAANLGWKLTLAGRGAPDALLDSYEQERRPVAKQVVWLTRMAFALEVSDIPPLSVGRRFVARPVAQLMLNRPRLVTMVARLVSGLDTRYRRGALEHRVSMCSRDRVGRRLEDLATNRASVDRLHDHVDASHFHLLVYGGGMAGDRTLEDVQDVYGEVLKCHRATGESWDHLFDLVRPDGYIAASGDDTSVAIGYLDRWVAQGGSTSSQTEASAPTDFSTPI